jgi:hypothetical protein
MAADLSGSQHWAGRALRIFDPETDPNSVQPKKNSLKKFILPEVAIARKQFQQWISLWSQRSQAEELWDLPLFRVRKGKKSGPRVSGETIAATEIERDSDGQMKLRKADTNDTSLIGRIKERNWSDILQSEREREAEEEDGQESSSPFKSQSQIRRRNWARLLEPQLPPDPDSWIRNYLGLFLEDDSESENTESETGSISESDSEITDEKSSTRKGKKASSPKSGPSSKKVDEA